MGPLSAGAMARGGTPLAGYSLGQVDVVTPASLFLKNLFVSPAGDRGDWEKAVLAFPGDCQILLSTAKTN
jgi:hypothetical protein